MTLSRFAIFLAIFLACFGEGQQKRRISPSKRMSSLQWVKQLNKAECGIKHALSMNKSLIPHPAKKGEFPWVVSIRLKSCLFPRHLCAGTIIHEHYVITLGTCTAGVSPESLEIISGLQNLREEPGRENIRDVQSVYNTASNRVCCDMRDLSIIKVKKPYKFSQTVAPICLVDDHFPITSDVIVADWQGLDIEKPDSVYNLYWVTLQVLSRDECVARYHTAQSEVFVRDMSRACAVPYDSVSCQGSVGGPVMCENNGRYYLCGVLNWGNKCMDRDDVEDLPAVFSDMRYFYQGIVNRTLTPSWF